MRRCVLLLALVCVLAPASASARGSAGIASLQVALRAHGTYPGTVDGYAGPGTRRAVRAYQRRAGLAVDGVAGPRTRRALGRLARPRLGRRALRLGSVGGDVSALQFLLEWAGFPSGTVDGGFGPHVDAALRRFQRRAGLGADGVAGPHTIAALRRPPPRNPVALRAPVLAPLGDPFGPRGAGFHPAADFPAPTGTSVRAARSGRVVFAGWDAGGYGMLVVLGHGRGLTTWYAHLSRILVGRGERVRVGERIGRVGATGLATGPHLHFEVRDRGAAVRPF